MRAATLSIDGQDAHAARWAMTYALEPRVGLDRSLKDCP